jgi:hypothetical protein
MNLVLRLGGDEVDVENLSKLTTLVPYRIDRRGVGRSKTNCLFYGVNDTESQSELEAFLSLKKFLRENRTFLDAVRKIDGVTTRDVDIGVIVPSNIAAKTLILDADLLKSLGEAGLSVAVSIYKGSDKEDEAPN